MTGLPLFLANLPPIPFRGVDVGMLRSVFHTVENTRIGKRHLVRCLKYLRKKQNTPLLLYIVV